MIFLSFFAVPMVIAIGAYMYFGARITFKEFLLQTVAQAFVVGIVCFACYGASTYDRETWNGRVASKERDVVSCGHAYPCNPYPCNCGKNGCSTCWRTCYMHSFDVDWNVYTTNREGLSISRVDLQGINEPPRWTAVKVGEPTARPHGYVNYIKAAPNTIFREQSNSSESFPNYPDGYYDYYRLDRLVQLGTAIPDAAEWNRDLDELNADLGKEKQVNVILVTVKGKSREWFKGLQRTWIGGKKNDVAVVIGLNADDTVAWADTMAWTDYAYFRVKLRDDILGIGKLDRPAIMAAIKEDTIKYFKRKPMSDFEYLAASVTPTTTQYFVGLFFSVLAAFVLSWFMAENDVFGEEPSLWSYGYGRREPAKIRSRWMSWMYDKKASGTRSGNVNTGGW